MPVFDLWEFCYPHHTEKPTIDQPLKSKTFGGIYCKSETNIKPVC